MKGFTDKISLWNGRTETWLADLDVIDKISKSGFSNITLALCKNLLLVINSDKDSQCKILFWKVTTSQPFDSSPQYLGAVVSHKLLKESLRIQANQKYVVLFDKSSSDLLFIQKKELFTEDLRMIAEPAQLADPSQPGNPWRYIDLKIKNHYNRRQGSKYFSEHSPSSM
jgi:hypothetical protein